MVSPWNLSDTKSPQVSRTPSSILSDLNNAPIIIIIIIIIIYTPVRIAQFLHLIRLSWFPSVTNFLGGVLVV